MNEETIISFGNQNGFRIAPDSDITTGKVIVNGIEITSVEDWEKVTNSLIKLEHNWNKLKKWLEEYLDGARSGLDSYDCGIGDCLDDVLRKMQSLEEGGNNE